MEYLAKAGAAAVRPRHHSDGLDTQILGFAIPSMIKEWSVTRGDFAPALALAFVGMTVGTPIGGIVGDWLGRKVALIASVFLFGAATLPIAVAL